jgi:hypothetical protein
MDRKKISTMVDVTASNRALLCAQRGPVKEVATMPQYVFFCLDCNKEFTRTLHMNLLQMLGS